MNRVGIILAGGTGSRLFPLTYTISKQLLPIYDKPMIYYSLSILMLANIREILLITTSKDLVNYKNLLGDGSRFGLKISYKVQKEPRGLAEAFILGEEFIKKRPCALILGDNLFYGSDLQKNLIKVSKSNKNTIFAFKVSNPKDYGVIEFDNKNKVLSIQEKPIKPKSNYAAVGLYFYNNEVCKISKNLKPSKRGELEITDLNNILLKKQKLLVEKLGRGYAWLDTGNPNNLIDASTFIKTIQERQNIQIASIEEIAFNKKWIDKNLLKKSVKIFKNSTYGEYLKSLL